jgi:hypothetical protein
MNVNRATPNLGPRVSFMANDGTLLNRIGADEKPGTGPGQFVAPHSIAFDSTGDLYIGEVAATDWESLFPGQVPPPALRRMQKFARRRQAG